MGPEPTPIPEEIMELLGSAQVDWTSENWTNGFSSFFGKGLAQSTHKTYEAAPKGSENFVTSMGFFSHTR